jgi:glycosyltransferase involved in cell wall biosynthesis
VDVTVVVATYGDEEWSDLAHERAIPSAKALDVPVIPTHCENLRTARNLGLELTRTERVIFLDADDELEPGYLEAMATGTADLRVPAVRYVKPKHNTPLARMPQVAGHGHRCVADCLAFGNWLVIGTLAPTELLKRVGGFGDEPIYEDWALWVRCWQAGATVEAIPQAVYRAHVRSDSRNRAPDRRFKHRVHQDIARANGLPVPA